MRRKLFALLAVAVMMTVAAGKGRAAESFSDTINFQGLTDSKGVTYIEITNSFTYTHTLEGLETPPYTLNSATLSLRHLGNSNNIGGEIWFATGEVTYEIDRLEQSNQGNNWVTEEWVLSDSILSLISAGNPWQLNVYLNETTPDTDKLKIDYSTLTVFYDSPTSAVPLPGTALILGSGLAGLAGTRLRKKR